MDLCGSLVCFAYPGFEAGDSACGGMGSLGRFQRILGILTCRGGLSLDSNGNAETKLLGVSHGRGNTGNRFNPLSSRSLNGSDILGYPACSGGELSGQRLDLLHHDSKAAARLACPGDFDRCIQREQIGLLGDCLDEANDFADFLRLVR